MSIRSMSGAFAALLALAAPATAAADDFAADAYNVLPPGESGAFPPGPNSTDQAAMYDGLTPLFGRVRMGDIRRLYKPNVFGTAGQGPTRREVASATVTYAPVPRTAPPRIVTFLWPAVLSMPMSHAAPSGHDATGSPSPLTICPLRSSVMSFAPITIPLFGQFARSVSSVVSLVIVAPQLTCVARA